MKKLFIAIALCTVCLGSYAQDSTKKKVKNKTENTKKEVKTKAKKISKTADNKTDSVVKKVYPNAHKVKP